MGFFKKLKKSIKKTFKKPLSAPKRILKSAKTASQDAIDATKKVGKETVNLARRVSPVGSEGVGTKLKKDAGRLLDKLSGAEATEAQTQAIQDANVDARRAAADARRSEVFAQTTGGGGGAFGNIALGVGDDEEDDEFAALRQGKTTLQL